jgi:hypothetical protein
MCSQNLELADRFSNQKVGVRKSYTSATLSKIYHHNYTKFTKPKLVKPNLRRASTTPLLGRHIPSPAGLNKVPDWTQIGPERFTRKLKKL